MAPDLTHNYSLHMSNLVNGVNHENRSLPVTLALIYLTRNHTALIAITISLSLARISGQLCPATALTAKSRFHLIDHERLDRRNAR